MCEEAINNHRLRRKIGNAAREYVATQRLEVHHAAKGFEGT